MKRETEEEYHERAMRDFDGHVASVGPGRSWRFKRPASSAYYFRITWAPGVLVCSGDIGELVVRHYSFDDPWSAAAWVNGAGFDYFMEKTTEKKEFDQEATARSIIETAYRQMRDEGFYYEGKYEPSALMKAIVEFNSCLDDANCHEARKEACRHLLELADCKEFEARDAYEITNDCEALRHDYPKQFGHQYMAFKKWAAWMWANEPLWHKALRKWWRLQEIRKNYRNYPIIWAPVLYVEYKNGKPTDYNGHKFWRWQKHVGRDGVFYAYHALRPWTPFGHDMTRFGFWRDQGSRTSDDGGMDGWRRPLDPGDGFRDVRQA